MPRWPPSSLLPRHPPRVFLRSYAALVEKFGWVWVCDAMDVLVDVGQGSQSWDFVDCLGQRVVLSRLFPA